MKLSKAWNVHLPVSRMPSGRKICCERSDLRSRPVTRSSTTPRMPAETTRNQGAKPEDLKFLTSQGPPQGLTVHFCGLTKIDVASIVYVVPSPFCDSYM
jgi:hypothetical protein